VCGIRDSEHEGVREMERDIMGVEAVSEQISGLTLGSGRRFLYKDHFVLN